MIELDGYEVIATLVQTEAKVLLRARAVEDGRAVVVKLLQAEHPAPGEVARLHHEHSVASGLVGDGFVRPLGVERFKRRVGLVMEDVGGGSLAAAIPPGGLGTGAFLRLARSLADSVGRLHEAGVIHRDVKPSNVLVDEALTRAWLVDFGIATRLPRLAQEAPVAARLEGTLAYVSPEQTGRMNRSVDHRSDLYSLGVTYHQMLTGRLPFRAAGALELIHCHLAVRPPSAAEVNPAVPAGVAAIVERLLAKSPEDRYQSAHGLAHDLAEAAARIEATGAVEAFPLGAADRSSRFLIPERLYGRETEIAALGAVVDRVASGERALVLLSGGAGMGKTALVGELQPAIAGHSGYFCEGKFDQFSRNVPFASLVGAVGGLVRQILAEPAERVAAWRHRIADALGPNVAVVTDVIPDLGLVVGEAGPVPPLGPTETQNRFNIVFRELIGVFARPEHPLVMFLDDLHWADLASLKLLVTLLSDADLRHLLIVGAYRPAEVSESHPLTVTLTDLDPAAVHRLDVGPLPARAAGQLVSESLRVPAAELAAFLCDRSGGNIFFLRQLFDSLVADGLVRFEGGRWTWEIDAVKAHGLTGDVVELMVGKLASLPAETQELLRLASVIGNRFDLATLAAVLGQSVVAVAGPIWPALAAGLVLPLDDDHELVGAGLDGAGVAYRFLHDRVQQACHSTIEPEVLPALHLRIGELLEQRLGGGDEGLFEVVEHLNGAAALITDPARRLELARLNGRAARRARASAAYDTAARSAQTAAELLAPDLSELVPELVLELGLLRAGVLAVLGRLDDAEELFERLQPLAGDDLAFGTLCEARCEALEGAGRLGDAYAIAQIGLARLGEPFPGTPEGVAAEEARLRTRLFDPSVIREFETLPRGDASAALVGKLFARAFVGAYTSRPEDAGLVMAKGAEHVLRAGVTPQSPQNAGLMSMVAIMHGHHELGVAYGEVVAPLVEANGAEVPRADLAAWVFALSWKHPFEDNERQMDRGFLACHNAGDLVYAMYSVWSGYVAALVAARDCHHTLELVDRTVDYGRRFVRFFTTQSEIRADALRRLMALPRPPLDVEATLHELHAAQNFTEFAEAQEELVRVEALLGEYRAAHDHGLAAEPYVRAGAAGTGIWNMPYYVFFAVACARLARQASDGTERDGLLAKADDLIAWVAPFAELWPDNWRHYHQLAVGERALAGGDPDGAMAAYQGAVDHAAAHGYTLLEAWGTELLARLHHEAGRRFATGYFAEARDLYRDCGAEAKAAGLEAEFPDLFDPGAEAGGFDDTRTTTDHGPGSLDLATVVKAGQAIASEIAYERVVDRLVAISVENAGAERGVFVPLDGDAPLPPSTEAPASVIQYVARTRQPVVIGDATRDDTFSRDPYVAERRPRSVAAGPIIRHDRLLGVLYLENTLLADAFTAERLELLRLLAAQMAISLDNARLYSRLEDEVATRTQDVSASLADLRAMQAQIVESEKLAALGGLVAGVAHEINTPVGVAVTAASHLADRTAEFATRYAAGPLRRSELERFTTTVADSGTLILTNLRRATDLVSSFKQVAVDQSSEAGRRFPVAAYLDDIVASLQPSFKRARHRVEIDCDPTLTLTSYPGALAQVVTNLVLNSITHAYEGDTDGTLRMTVSPTPHGVRVVYRDDGCGIPAHILPRIFEPFFTTRRSEGGSGLGLHVVHNLVTQRLAGSIHVTSEPGAGTRFTITIPDTIPDTVPGEAP